MISTVVVGGSVAGLKCSLALRRLGYEGRIVLCEAEGVEPYDKPPLSKAFMDENAGFARLASEEMLREANIELVIGAEATSLDLDRQRVAFRNGTVIHWQRLVIATGARPHRLPSRVTGAAAPIYVRDAGSARRLRRAAKLGRTAVIVGGGFLGLEIAATLVRAGIAVHVVEASSHLLARGLPISAARLVEHAHTRAGVTFHFGRTLSDLDIRENGPGRATLDDGTCLQADFAVAAVGAAPSVDWLLSSGIPIDNGVVCDSDLQTAQNVWAIGDCANWHNPRYGRRMRIEHWTSAVEQAAHVAKVIAGTRRNPEVLGCAVVPYVWSNQFDLSIQCVGVRGTSCIEVPLRGEGAVFFEGNNDNRLVGVTTMRGDCCTDR